MVDDDAHAALLREVRVLEKKLRRSEANRQRLEDAKERNERILRSMIRDLKAAEERAQSASQAKSQFLANISHEIRTPLNAVLGLSALLARSALDPGQLELLQTIRSSGEALLATIDDLLAFAKLEVGGIVLDVGRFHPGRLVEEVVALFAEPAERIGLELLCWVEPEVPRYVVGDLVRVRQILINVVGNAVKFTGRGEVSVRVGRAGEVLIVDVVDTGPGIDSALKERLFEPFVQGDGSATRRYGGTGLGLAISQQLARRMRGEIVVESAPGQGSRFSIRLPLPALEGGRATGEPSGELPAGRVLAALPSPRARESLEAALRGLPSLEVTGWPEVGGLLAAIDEDASRVVAVLIDKRLFLGTGADSGGESVAAALRARTPAPLLLISPFIERLQGTELADLGLAGEVTYPIRPSRLRRALADALAPAGARRGPRAQFEGRVLLAEDNPTNQRVASLLLNAAGCSVDVAAHGQEALTLFESGEYELVLMDCQMPEMDGFEATRAIRDRERVRGGRRTPIVALTASALVEERERCLSAGMDDYMAKPITPEAIEAVLARWVVAEAAALAGGGPGR